MVPIFGLWRRATRDPTFLPLWELLRLRGTRKLADRQPQALAFAVERCTRCASTGECQRLVAAGEGAKIDAFCPNTMYFRHLDAMRRHAPKTDLLAGPG